LPAH
jgi:hypothetical protein